MFDLNTRAGALHNFKFFEVTYEEDLDGIKIQPPAIAYVRKTGDFYFRHSPEYWFGRVGTHEANFSDREDDRWIWAPYSGGRSLFRATRIEYLPAIASQMLGTLIGEGEKKFDAKKYMVTGGFWKVAKDLWYLSHNYQFVELNEQTCGTEGERLYDIADGDIAVESPGRVWCIQGKTKNPDLTDKYFGRELKLIGEKPLIEGTPGIHIQKAKADRATIYESHTERIGFVVATSDIPKGATSFRCAVHPDSLPTASIGGAPNWIEGTQGPDDGEPQPHISPPNPNRPWNLNKFAWLQTPDVAVELAVTGFSPPTPGVMPSCLNATITLEQPCPVPLITGGSVYEKTDQTLFVGKPSRAFGWMPRGTYGGWYNQSTIDIQVRAHAWEYIDIGQEFGSPRKGDTTIKPYWSWIQWAGKRRFSHFRGMDEHDMVSIGNNNLLYGIASVDKNNLENPMRIHVNGKIQKDVGTGAQNIDGIWFGDSRAYMVSGRLPENAHTSFFGWPAPDGTSGVPLIVKHFNFDTVTLLAPVAKDIPAGTKMPIWLSSDLDSVTYAYYDFYEFMHGLEQWIEYKEIITYDAVVAKIQEIAKLSQELGKEHEKADAKASYFWYNPPYYVNRSLDDWLPQNFKKYGSTFIEVSNTLNKISGGLQRLIKTKPPSWTFVEYISLLRYSHRGVK